MTAPRRVHRYRDRDDLAQGVAERLLACLVELQSKQSLAQLCLSGGETANALYREMGRLVPSSEMDPQRLELWWASERYVATADESRHVLQALALLGGAFRVDPSRTHPMPARSEHVDVADAAMAYATDLGATMFDICLLTVGPAGTVASITPGSVADQATVSLVVGLTSDPERLTMTMPAINRSKEVWVLASGEDKAEIVAEILTSPSLLPAARAHGTRATRWFIDASAAAALPTYRCDW